MLPAKDVLVGIVRSGQTFKDKDAEWARMTNVPELPSKYRELAVSFDAEGRKDVAEGYRGIADTIDAVLAGRELPVRKLPSADWIEQLRQAHPIHNASISLTLIAGDYVAAAASLLYGQYKD